ncbi:hypothetical protein I4U23_030248 [Adineta vaga]|nr:hypothetical protein I4U23_030248 [Adineta vaga]
MSNIVDLADKSPLTDIDHRSKLLWDPDNYQLTSFDGISKNDSSMELYGANSELDAFESIIVNKCICTNENMNNVSNNLPISVKEQLKEYVQKHKDAPTSLPAVVEFNNSFKIYLHFIAFRVGKFQLTNKYTFLHNDKEKRQAFIVLNGDNTICGPLFIHATQGERKFLFDLDDMRVQVYVDRYIEKLNRTDPRSFPVKDETSSSNVCCNSSTNELMDLADALMNESHKINAVSSKKKRNIRSTNDQNEQKFIRTVEKTILCHRNNTDLTNSASVNVSTTHQQGTPCTFILNQPSIIRMSDHGGKGINDVSTTGTMLANTSMTTTPLPSDTVHVPQSIPTPMSTSISYAKPEILKQPQENWKIRYPRDIIPQQNTGAQENGKIFTGLLQGVGSQRSQIEVKVPLRMNRQMYLASMVRTINNLPHSLKIIVPEKTKVNKDRFNRDNYLNYFEFNNCNSNYIVDLDALIIYMKITPLEHQQQIKKIPIYMFNLYQNQHLTKDLINREQLEKCQLAFWLCVRQNGNFIRISPDSLSRIITEKKK